LTKCALTYNSPTNLVSQKRRNVIKPTLETHISNSKICLSMESESTVTKITFPSRTKLPAVVVITVKIKITTTKNYVNNNCNKLTRKQTISINFNFKFTNGVVRGQRSVETYHHIYHIRTFTGKRL